MRNRHKNAAFSNFFTLVLIVLGFFEWTRRFSVESSQNIGRKDESCRS